MKLVGELNGHKNEVICLHNHNENILISGSIDKTVRLWDMNTLKAQRCLLCTDMITSIISHKAQENLIYVASNQHLFLFDIRKENSIVIKKPHKELLQCSDEINQINFNKSGQTMVIGDDSGIITLFDINKMETTYNLQSHSNICSCVVFCEQRLVSGSMDCCVNVYDYKRQRKIHQFDMNKKSNIEKKQNVKSATQKRLANKLKKKKQIKNNENDNNISKIRPPSANGSQMFNPPFILSLDSFKHELLGGLGNGEIVLWNVAERQEKKRYYGHYSGVSNVIFTNKDEFISAGNDCWLNVWSMKKGLHNVNALQFTENDKKTFDVEHIVDRIQLSNKPNDICKTSADKIWLADTSNTIIGFKLD